MKRLALTVLSAILILACAKVKFIEYRGDKIFHGQGGAVETIYGIEVWQHGTPNRAYKILGVLSFEDKKRNRKAAAKMIKQIGGDAAIVFAADEKITGYVYTGYWAIPARGTFVRVAAIKYMDKSK